MNSIVDIQDSLLETSMKIKQNDIRIKTLHSEIDTLQNEVDTIEERYQRLQLVLSETGIMTQEARRLTSQRLDIINRWKARADTMETLQQYTMMFHTLHQERLEQENTKVELESQLEREIEIRDAMLDTIQKRVNETKISNYRVQLELLHDDIKIY